LVSGHLFRVNVVAHLGAELRTVAPFPHLNADNGKNKKTTDNGHQENPSTAGDLSTEPIKDSFHKSISPFGFQTETIPHAK
jgi:hypothetical protein